jgi:hypothetical protein
MALWHISLFQKWPVTIQKFGSPASILKNGMEKLFGSTLVVSFVQSLFQLFLVYTLYLTSNVQDTIISFFF